VTVIDADADRQPDDGRWLTIQEAARYLSVSERTIFRRTERGQLRRRSRVDGHVEVWAPLTPDAGVSRQSADADGQERALLLVERVGEAVSRQVAPLVAELAAGRERIAELARENGRLQERAVTLERELSAARRMADSVMTAPKDPEPAPAPKPRPPTPDGRPAENDSPSESFSAPWWRRWWAVGLL
jgi:excisionase family DNA binding protein